jgi:hypothetical protein
MGGVFRVDKPLPYDDRVKTIIFKPENTND